MSKINHSRIVFGLLAVKQDWFEAAMATIHSGTIRELTVEQGRDLLDAQTREYLNMSGQEFIQKWESGEFGDDQDQPEIMRLVMLIPFAK